MNDEDALLQQEEEASFMDLYWCFLFFLGLYLTGDVFCGGVLKIVPALVGQIVIGILVGPYVLNVLLEPITLWQTLGNVGLVLFLCQAGMEMDLEILQTVGSRSACMAVVGSLLPTCIGFTLAYFVLNLQWESAIAVGCSFGPTSAGIAMNVLGSSVLQSAIGQLVVAIAIVDDILALVILSQLKALVVDDVSISSLIIPIISALLWLGVGGYIALYRMPEFLIRLEHVEQKLYQQIIWMKRQQDNDSEDSDSIMPNFQLINTIVVLFVLLPATYYTQASYLMGAFLAGLCFCRQESTCQAYTKSFSVLIDWLMRIFFGATIGFSVPVTLFNNVTVIGRGFLLALALLGKIATGPLLTPKSLAKGNKKDHWRNCAIVGFSMAGEAEFAFLVAGFGRNNNLLTEEIYASVVFAILLSTIVSPVLLRTTLALYPVVEEEEAISTRYKKDDHDDNKSSSDDMKEELNRNVVEIHDEEMNP